MLKELFKNVNFLDLDTSSIQFWPYQGEIPLNSIQEDLKLHLKHFHQVTGENPFANPIVLLALYITKKLEKNELSFSSIEKLIQYFNTYSFTVRAERLKQYIGKTDPLENLNSLNNFFENILQAGQYNDIQSFKKLIEQTLFGFVVTAHPTFSLHDELLRILSDLASRRNFTGVLLDEVQIKGLIEQVFQMEHVPDSEITIEKEHSLAIDAILNLRQAITRLYETFFKKAAQIYPNEWWQLRPKIVTAASWVGYDLDGRKDIAWTQSFAFRLEERKLALRRYSESTLNIIELCPINSKTEALRNILAHILSILNMNLAGTDEEIEAFKQASSEANEYLHTLRKISKKMFNGLSKRLVRPSDLVHLLDRAIESAGDLPLIRQRLCLLRAEMENFGLGVSHIHVRLNAKQIHNAVRNLIGMETDPEDPGNKRTYLKALNSLIDATNPVTINFGSLIAERTTAKRLFMLVSQIFKYIDSETPIRFLMAETESSFTPIAALYFAKLFQVEDKIDISPLFETPRALLRGAKIVDGMIANEHYKNYIITRNRLCVQTGFSDAGRHLGQPAASFAIENFRLKLAETLDKHNLNAIEVVIFNTHGESMGRGTHPGSFTKRLQYLMSPKSRHQFIERGVKLKEEISFQGGDGYVFLLNPYCALAVLTRIVEFLQDGYDRDDPIYEHFDYTSEFFVTIQQFNEKIMQDQNYAVLLQKYGRNFLLPTGSRAFKRQKSEKPQSLSAADVRAIPHNAILHQLGLLANTVGGVGQAIKKDPERFEYLTEKSDRFSLLMSMVEYALSFCDPYAFLGYLAILDPGFWLMLASKAPNPQHAQEIKEVADHLEKMSRFSDLSQVGRFFYRDLLDLVETFRGTKATQKNLPLRTDCLYHGDGLWMDEELREAIEILHGLRLAIIYQIFTLAIQIPEFSPQQGTTREEILEAIFHLEVEDAVETLKSIFPLLEKSTFAQDFGEKASYHSDLYGGYTQEHENIFNPLLRLKRLIHRITGGISHIIGSFG